MDTRTEASERQQKPDWSDAIRLLSSSPRFLRLFLFVCVPRVSATMRMPSLYVMPKTEEVVTTGLVVSLGGEGKRPVIEHSKAV